MDIENLFRKIGISKKTSKTMKTLIFDIGGSCNRHERQKEILSCLKQRPEKEREKVEAILEIAEQLHIQKLKTWVKPGEVLSESCKAAQYARYWIGRKEREEMIVFLLDTQNKVISVESVSIGSNKMCIVDPREVLKEAVRKNATSILLAHNHPSGNCKPSHEDIQVTKRINQACSIIGLNLLDHLIVSENDYFSMYEEHRHIFSH